MYLMCKDVPVVRFGKDSNDLRILNKNLLPPMLRETSIETKDVLEWLRSRSIPLLRGNAKPLLNQLGLSYDAYYDIIYVSKGLSLIDSYWIREDTSTLTWSQVSLFEQDFSPAISELAYLGRTSSAIEADFLTPELTCQGGYVKTWSREQNKIYLYKANTLYGKESENEVVSSKILDILQFDHVDYELCDLHGFTSSRCLTMTTPDLAIVPMIEIQTMLNRKKINYLDWLRENFHRDFMQMLLFDGIVHNVDRHFLNWGFYMDSNTGALLRPHPLFDHNCAVEISAERTSQQYDGKTLLDVAVYAYRQLGRPKEVRELRSWLESRPAKKLFDRLYTRERGGLFSRILGGGGDRERLFILSRVNKVIES